VGPNSQMFPFPMGGPNGFPDFHTTDPKVIRNEVIPQLVQMGQTGRANGTINEMQFNELMKQVMILKESSLIKEQEMREQERGRGFDGPGGLGRPILLGPPPVMNGCGDPGEALLGALNTRSPHKNDLPLADARVLEEIENDPTRRLNIDDIPREIRYYAETATIVMSDNEICDLSFQPEQQERRVIIDNIVEVFIGVNQTAYKSFELDGETHQLKIGPPTRELWIDGAWHECFFNTHTTVRIGQKMHDVIIEGSPPTVKIGEPRPDLCPGRVYALLDGAEGGKVPIYLDKKPQIIDIASKPHVIQFVAGFKTLTINGHPFRADFGGFPMVISVMGKKHYLKLTYLPNGVSPECLEAPVPTSRPGRFSPMSEMENKEPVVKNGLSVSPEPGRERSPAAGQDEVSQDGSNWRKDDPLNSLVSLIPNTDSAQLVAAPGSSYNTNDGPAETPAPPAAAATPPVQPNTLGGIDWDMLSKLLKPGPDAGGGIPGLSLSAPAPAPAEMPVLPPPELKPPPVVQHTPKLKLPVGPIRPILLASHHSSLRERQEAVVLQLYGREDLQCKSCGVRFSKEEMPQYTSHLDWHFRVKRREKDNARRAQSRKWYFEKVDWIVCDEIEDEPELPEETAEEQDDIVISTVAVGEGERNNSACPVCREEFDQFYKQAEGVEEGGWYLHNAMRHEGVLYHPECFKDMEKNTSMETASADTTMESLDRSDHPVKLDQQEEKMESGEKEENIEQPSKLKMESENPSEEDLKAIDSLAIKEETPIPIVMQDQILTGLEIDSLTEIKTEAPVVDVSAEDPEEKMDSKSTDDNDNNVEIKEETENGEKEELKEDAEEGVEKTAAGNNSLVDDAVEMSAPVVAQPKVEIKVNILNAVKPLERMESSHSALGDAEDSEFDPEAIVLPAPSEEELASQKPRMKGRKLTVMPPRKLDSDLSGLCSIM